MTADSTMATCECGCDVAKHAINLDEKLGQSTILNCIDCGPKKCPKFTFKKGTYGIREERDRVD